MSLHDYFLNRIDCFFGSISEQRNWKIIFVLIFTLLIFLCSFPNYHFLKDNQSTSNTRIEFINRQIEHPFDKSVFDNLDSHSHESKRALRLFVPLVAHTFFLNYHTVFLFESLLGILFLYFFLDLVYKLISDKILSGYFLLAISSLYVGKSSFYDVGAYYDFFAFFIMLIMLKSRSYSFILLLIVLGGFVDERFLVALPLVFLYKVYEINFDLKKSVSTLFVFVVGASVVFLFRYFLRSHFLLGSDMESDSNIGFTAFRLNYHFLPIGLFSGLEFLWVVLACAIFELYKRGQRILVYSLLFSVFSVCAVSFFVFDITRSMSYLFPAILFSILVLKKEGVISHYVLLIKYCCIGCFLFATIYVEGPNNADWISPIIPKIFKLF